MFTAVRPVLLTGGTGFLGRSILATLRSRGHQVLSLGRSPGNDVVCDLSTTIPHLDNPPGLVIHNAGKAHVVPTNLKEAREFFDVSLVGTTNLLKTLLELPGLPDAIVFISSVSVYGIKRGRNISEDRSLSAKDAYGRSKIGAENLLISWCDKYNVPLTILRLPLVAGPDPPGNLGAMIEGIRKGYYLTVAGGHARKSMVMASDVASVIINAAENPGIYHLTDGHHPSLGELATCIARQLNVRPPRNINEPMAKALGVIGGAVNVIFPGKSSISSTTIAKLTSTLTFDDTKARNNLGWNPRRVIDALRLH